MSDTSKKKSASDLLRDYPISLAGVGAILLLLGLTYSAYDAHHFKSFWDYFFLFLKELGFALIIAYFITVGIESSSRNRHNDHVTNQIDQIKRNVFDAVYKTRQDAGLVSLLETEIFKKGFFRTGYELQMTFEYVDKTLEKTPESFLRVDVCSRFYVTNTTTTSSTFNYSTFVEKPFDESLQHQAVLNYLKVGDHVLTEDELKKADTSVDDTADFRKYAWPKQISGGEAIYVLAKYTIFKHARDSLNWQVLDSCDGLKLTVFHPKEIVIFGDAVHPCSDSIDKSGGTENDQTFDLRIDQPLLPRNGIQIWWSPSKSTAASKAVAGDNQDD